MKDINIIEGNIVWYFMINESSEISELKYSKVLSITYDNLYHNITEIIYELENGEKINNIEYNIYLNELNAIESYNRHVNNLIDNCNYKINKLKNNKKSLKTKLIKKNHY